MAHILLVDDDNSLRNFIAKALENDGHEVSGFDNAPEALNALSVEHPAFDLILTDIVMPEMDGFEFSQKLKKTNPNIPVIFMSGFLGLDGDQDIIPKPFHLNDIVNRVKETLAKQIPTP